MTTSIGIGSGIGFGGSIVNPMAIVGAANTKLWLRADLGVTLVSGETDAWADQSPNARHFTAPASGFRPAAPADDALLNGKKSIYFPAATGRHLGNPNSGSYWDFLHDGPDFTLFMAFVSSPTDVNADDFIFGTGSRNSALYGGIMFGVRSRAAPNGSPRLSRLYNAAGGIQSTFGTSTEMVLQPEILMFDRNNSLATKNSNDSYPMVPGRTFYNDSIARGGGLFFGATIGCRDDIGLHSDARVSEIFVADIALDTLPYNAVFTYFKNRYFP